MARRRVRPLRALALELAAARRIQRGVRMFVANCRVNAMRRRRLRNASASLLQAQWRGRRDFLMYVL
jgi:hypothetical protein